MALFMDVHTINGGVSLEDVATAHAADLAIQGEQPSGTCATANRLDPPEK